MRLVSFSTLMMIAYKLVLWSLLFPLTDCSTPTGSLVFDEMPFVIYITLIYCKYRLKWSIIINITIILLWRGTGSRRAWMLTSCGFYDISNSHSSLLISSLRFPFIPLFDCEVNLPFWGLLLKRMVGAYALIFNAYLPSIRMMLLAKCTVCIHVNVENLKCNFFDVPSGLCTTIGSRRWRMGPLILCGVSKPCEWFLWNCFYIFLLTYSITPQQWSSSCPRMYWWCTY